MWPTAADAALLTDLYELTMSASYFAQDMGDQEATFDLFIREVPKPRNFLVAAGLEDALDYLETLHFDDEALGYLRSLDMFSEEFLGHLGKLRFSGDVWAIPEGEIFFAGEPVLRVTGPLVQAQLVETFLINCVAFQSMVASKAARVNIACRDCQFVDFSLRRDHGADAGLKAARAAYIGGASATSNVLAGKRYGIPVSGTMAHSYVMSFPSEEEAFRAYAREFPNRAILLIDTFDVEEGARRAALVANDLASEGVQVKGVRIDSGDVATLARSVRKILDEAGLHTVQIILSGDMDEYRIKQILDEGAPVDAFGVGTQLGTSGDAPFLGGVYKLVHDEQGPKVKLSVGKVTLPGRKQIYREERGGVYQRDVIALEDEHLDGRPLLSKVLEGGRRVDDPEPLDEMRQRCAAGITRLPERLHSLEQASPPYPVDLSERLTALADSMKAEAR
ncbi:MAG TPA: nicotinate phosphoribosyltransferase [Actinomycetota bacterium]|nr:nicotinate phosphoribosyltransferase [Actinomycetota bacterium]